jgi:predicted nucleotidyltransferase
MTEKADYNNVANNPLDIFCRENSIELLVLFGSSAKGENNETSDADLAVKAVAGARAAMGTRQATHGREDVTCHRT